jgi:hypothetical protein
MVPSAWRTAARHRCRLHSTRRIRAVIGLWGVGDNRSEEYELLYPAPVGGKVDDLSLVDDLAAGCGYPGDQPTRHRLPQSFGRSPRPAGEAAGGRRSTTKLNTRLNVGCGIGPSRPSTCSCLRETREHIITRRRPERSRYPVFWTATRASGTTRRTDRWLRRLARLAV